jgi:apolipoprotein N-acyltransferase
MLWLLKWLRVVGPDAWIALSCIQALFIALLGAGLAAVSRLRTWPLWAATLWVLQELVRDRQPFGGFPWGRLAFAHTDTPYTPLAALAGAPAVTFAVALTASLLAWAVLHLRSTPWKPAAALAAACVLPATAYAVPVPTTGQTAGGPADTTVAVVQGNVPRSGLDFLGQRRAVLDNHANATHKLAEDVRAGRTKKPDLVIWPENSSDLNPFNEPDAFRIIDNAVKDIGVPVLTGVLVEGPDDTHIQNQGIVWDPNTGPGQSYTKRHPVPFGEYIPFRSLLTKMISRLDRVPRDFYAGKDTNVMQVGPARIGDVICFEIAYDEIVRDAVNNGGRALVVQTNNATYGRSGQPEQQLAMSKLRAVETGRAVLIAATSGISGVITPDGKVAHRTKEFTAQTITTTIPLRDTRTLATRLGATPEWTLAAIAAAALLYALALPRITRRRAGKTPTTTPHTTTPGKIEP